MAEGPEECEEWAIGAVVAGTAVVVGARKKARVYEKGGWLAGGIGRTAGGRRGGEFSMSEMLSEVSTGSESKGESESAWRGAR
jgi:hypothetical protein